MNVTTGENKQDCKSVQPLRPYQKRAVIEACRAWQTARRVLCVAPTGAGKTRLGEEFVALARGKEYFVLWIAHRRELLKQAASRLAKRFHVGIIAPGFDSEPYAEVQVATVQTLLARGSSPFPADAKVLVIFDEAHHYVADDWAALQTWFPQARILGLTATPERQDGKPLGDGFDVLVVAANYSELLKDGHLVPARVYQPPEILGSDLAQDPLVAYQRHGENAQAFVFCATVEEAYKQAARFTEAGILSVVVEAKTKTADRDVAISDFEASKIRCLFNVYALTEGVDVPAARVCILARAFGHVSPFLQACGRVLRPHKNKPDAIIIDLTGATLAHGFPTEDRVYALDGKGITRTTPGPLRQCPKCGATLPGRPETCSECGFEFPVEKAKVPRIYDLELRAVFAGADTPSTAKEREYKRLRRVQREKKLALYFVQKAYKDLFGEMPVISDATVEEMQEEYERLRAFARQRGFKPGYVGQRFKATFGDWPSRALPDNG